MGGAVGDEVVLSSVAGRRGDHHRRVGGDARHHLRGRRPPGSVRPEVARWRHPTRIVATAPASARRVADRPAGPRPDPSGGEWVVIDGIDRGGEVGHWSDPEGTHRLQPGRRCSDLAAVVARAVRRGRGGHECVPALDLAGVTVPIDRRRGYPFSGVWRSAWPPAVVPSPVSLGGATDRVICSTMAGRAPGPWSVSAWFDLGRRRRLGPSRTSRAGSAAASAIAGAPGGTGPGPDQAPAPGATAPKRRGTERAVPGGLVGALRRETASWPSPGASSPPTPGRRPRRRPSTTSAAAGVPAAGRHWPGCAPLPAGTSAVRPAPPPTRRSAWRVTNARAGQAGLPPRRPRRLTDGLACAITPALCQRRIRRRSSSRR